jgi:hypothetical protein
MEKLKFEERNMGLSVLKGGERTKRGGGLKINLSTKMPIFSV